MKNKISIIIPIYNCENYIAECLVSIIKQSYKNIEIIIINDGSTDNTLNIVREIAKSDKRIKIINQRNKGVSYSRNVGIKISTGKYIMFVDADDIISEQYLEQMINQIYKKKLDILKTSYCCFSKNKQKENYSIIENKYKKINIKKLEEYFINTIILNSSCMQLINKDIIIANNIYFSDNLKFAEDFMFTYKLWKSSNKIGYLNNYGYKCRINESCSSKSQKMQIQLKFAYDCITAYSILKNKRNDEQVNSKILNHICSRILSSNISNVNYMEFKKEISVLLNDTFFKEIKYNKEIIFSKYKMIVKFLIKKKTFFLYLIIKLNSKRKENRK